MRSVVSIRQEKPTRYYAAIFAIVQTNEREWTRMGAYACRFLPIFYPFEVAQAKNSIGWRETGVYDDSGGESNSIVSIGIRHVAPFRLGMRAGDDGHWA